jgi:hypothetical protein
VTFSPIVRLGAGTGSEGDAYHDDRAEEGYNEERPHQGRWCFGKTAMQILLDGKPLAQEKMIRAA